ncbi:hypothetical protein [Sandaracinus amylolyticus]|nr:hypothetical protein [Sandaracinus amylolyticus]
MRVRSLIAIVSVLVLGACGGGGSSSSETTSSSTEGEGTTGGQATSSELEGFDSEGFEEGEPTVDHGRGSARELLGINPPPQPWDQMSHADQEMYMVAYVLPIHAEIFAEHDREEFAQFDCASCHGDDGPQRNYEMPSRSLPPLPPEGSERWQRAAQRDPEDWAFMTDVVLPTIRTQLGEPEMTCFGCHPQSTR